MKAQVSNIPIQAPEIQFIASDGDSEFEDEPFNPGPVDTENEPDYFSPNLHNNWCWLWQQALEAGHLAIVQVIVALFIYQRAKTPCVGRSVILSHQRITVHL